MKIFRHKRFTHQNFIRKISGGFMAVEMLVAISIISVSILATMSVAQKSIQVSRQALHTSQASFLLEEGAEVVRVLRDNSWTNISGLTPGVIYYPVFADGSWELLGSANSVGIFTRTISVENVNRDSATDDISVNGVNDPKTRLINVEVSWVEGGTIVTKTLQFYLVDIFS